MEKGLDVRRGVAGRFLPRKRQINGVNLISEKSKKQRLRRLSVVGKVSSSNKNCQMGCVGSEGEGQFLGPNNGSSKKSELSRKFSDDCNASAHSPVPRKLRTAMKKRNRKTLSTHIPDLAKLNYVTDRVESSRRNGPKKPKLTSKQRDLGGSLRKASTGSITKDEEEVVEALYSLAVMFPSNERVHTTSNGEFAEANSSALPDTENNVPASAAPRTEDCSNTSTGDVNPSVDLEEEEEANANIKVKSFEESSEPGVPNSNHVGNGLDDSAPKQNLGSVSMLKNSEAINPKQIYSNIRFDVPSEICLGPSVVSFPSWLSNSTSAVQPAAMELDDSRIQATNEKKFRKKCAVHVYITHLIKVLTSEKTEGLRLQPERATEDVQRVVVAPRTINEAVNGLNGIVCGSRVDTPSDNKGVNELGNGISLHERLLQDQQQASTSLGLGIWQKQSFDLTSLSVGGGGLEAKNTTYRKEGTGLVPPTPSCRQSVAKNHPLVPFYPTENNYSTTHHLKAISIPPVQQPLYLGSPSDHTGMTGSLMQQHRLRVYQLAARHKFEGVIQGRIQDLSTTNLQSLTQDYPYPSSIIQYGAHKANIYPSAHLSFEAPPPPPPPSSNYAPISQEQQQQQLMYMASSSRAVKDHHRLPFGYYVGNGGGDTAPLLQLRCNEHHP